MATTKIRWVFRHFPLASHPMATSAAEAAECAAEQGKFWEYCDALFDFGSEIKASMFITIAKNIGINKESFKECLRSRNAKHSCC
jgi:protein-disulfide isomerase